MLGGIPLSEYSSEEQNHSKNSIRKNKNKFDQTKEHIAIFGGSTTYDIGLYDDDAWVSIIDELLPSYNVSNNGVPGYSSAEHVIQTAFYPDRAGKMPICNVYLMGWNDIRNFGIKDLDSGYANFHLLSQYGNLNLRKSLGTPSPIMNFLLMNFGVNELPFPLEEGMLDKDITSADMVFTFAARNIKNIVAINKERNINSLFIAQILNKSMLEKNDDIFGWVPYVKNSDLWPLQKRFNNMVNEISKEKRFFYYSPNEDLFSDQDFLDHGHFSKEGAIKFANLVMPKVKESCNLQ
jgi:lysophospholipase L1-like esterase